MTEEELETRLAAFEALATDAKATAQIAMSIAEQARVEAINATSVAYAARVR